MTSSELKVPFFNTYYPRQSNMTQDQLEFYSYWCYEMKRKNYIDVKGNLGYLFIYLYSLFIVEDCDEILRELLLLKKHFGEYEKFDEYCNEWIRDCFIVKGRFNEALNYTPNDLNVMMNAGIKVTLETAIKSSFERSLFINFRDYIRFAEEIYSEIKVFYKNYELENSLDLVSLCFKIEPDHHYHLFPGVPLIPTRNKKGEIDYGVPIDSSTNITSFGVSPRYTEITFYEFDYRRFEETVPNSLKMAIEIIEKRHKFTVADRYKTSLDKWLRYHPMRARHFSDKEVFGQEETYLYEASKTKYPIDKHHWLSSLVYWYYRNREHSGFIEKAIKYGNDDIELFTLCINQFEKKDFEGLSSELGMLLNSPTLLSPEEHLVNSFSDVVKMLATIYEKTKRYKEAVEICERAIKLKIKDTTTKGGLEGRLAKLRKKL